MSDIRTRLAKWIAPEYSRSVDFQVGQRVAEIMTKMDPFEPLMRQFNGVFGEEFEHPEDGLDTKGQLMLRTLGYQLSDDPSFKYLMNWVMNSQGNETIKRAPVTIERILYGRAQISSTLTIVNELRRLGEAYKDMLGRQEDFDESLTIEE